MSLFDLRAPVAPATAPRARRPSDGATSLAPGAGSTTPWPILAAIAAIGACALAAITRTALVNGDGVWHLIWGRELAAGSLGTFAPGPTPHPLMLAVAVLTSALGDGASYVVTYALFGPLAFGALLASAFEVARQLSSRWAGAIAIAVLAASAGILSMAGSARYDVAFAALVMTAIALELHRPRRGVAPLVCLTLAGLIRPEAWLLAGLYWVWLLPGIGTRERLRGAALVAAAPLLWAAMDLAVTGDPLHSLHATDAGSDALYRQYSPGDNMLVAGRNLIWFLGAVPALLVLPAAALLARDRPARAAGPLAVLAVTIAVFALQLSQGMASSARYLLVPVCMLAILVAAAVDGGGVRTPRRVVAGAILGAFVCLHAAAHVAGWRDVEHDAAAAQSRFASAGTLVAAPGVRRALRECPAVAFAGGHMLHPFAFFSGRPPEEFVPDPRGRTRPDVYLAPASAEVARAVLTRARFDDNAFFRVPAALRAGPRNADWALYLAPRSPCVRALL